MSFNVEEIRRDFPVLAQNTQGGKLVYFDNAASAQKPLQVIEAEARFYSHDYSNIHRSAHELSRRATSAFENARKVVAGYFKAPKDFACVFTRGATESLNIVAHCWGTKYLRAGDEILLSQMEHHANIVPWQMCAEITGAKIKVAQLKPNGELDMESFKSLLSDKTKIVSIAHASNVLGSINDVSEISRLARKFGAAVSFDCAQSSPHFLDDLSKMDCDFISLSAHKCFGPTGVGALIAKTDILNSLNPWMGGGDMIENVSWLGTTFRNAPERFEAGTPNIAGAVAFAEALKYLSSLDIGGAKKHEHELLERATLGLSEIPEVEILGTSKNKVPLISFACKGIHPNDVSTMLDAAGIAVRSGHHCAEPLMNSLGLIGSCRASFAFYNTIEEVDYFVSKLKSIIRIFA